MEEPTYVYELSLQRKGTHAPLLQELYGSQPAARTSAAAVEGTDFLENEDHWHESGFSRTRRDTATSSRFPGHYWEIWEREVK